MVELGPTSLAFLGRREYLHSTEIFQYFCDTVASFPPDRQAVFVESFKFLRETNRNGRAYLFEADEQPSQGSKPVATIVYRDTGGRTRRFEITDDGDPITERHPDPPPYCGPFAMRGDFSGTFECQRVRSPADLFAAFMEASKVLHMDTRRARGEDPDRLYRFVACEGLNMAAPPADGRLQLTFRHLRLRRAGERQFTFNEITASHLPDAPVKVCVAF